MADTLVWNSFLNSFVSPDVAAGLLNPPAGSGIPAYQSGVVLPQGQTFTASAPSTKWGDISKGISGVINSVFPVIWSFTKAGQAQAQTAAAAAASQQATAAKAAASAGSVQEYLLIAGVAVLGVVLALMIFKKQPAKG